VKNIGSNGTLLWKPKKKEHVCGARSYPKLVLNKLKINMKRTTSIYVTLNQDISKYLKFLKLTQNISKTYYSQVYNCIMNL
jgi:hypothetical protein